MIPSRFTLPRLQTPSVVIAWAAQLINDLERALGQLGTGLAVVALPVQTAAPNDPAQTTEARLYLRAGKLVCQYNDGGTVRYKYLDLTGTGTTWTHTTVAP